MSVLLLLKFLLYLEIKKGGHQFILCLEGFKDAFRKRDLKMLSEKVWNLPFFISIHNFYKKMRLKNLQNWRKADDKPKKIHGES